MIGNSAAEQYVSDIHANGGRREKSEKLSILFSTPWYNIT